MSKEIMDYGFGIIETRERFYTEQYVNKLNQRITELEEQLKNTRVKYCIGFDSEFNMAVKEMDLNVILPVWMRDKDFQFYDTKEEAEAKLQELQGE